MQWSPPRPSATSSSHAAGTVPEAGMFMERGLISDKASPTFRANTTHDPRQKATLAKLCAAEQVARTAVDDAAVTLCRARIAYITTVTTVTNEPLSKGRFDNDD